MQGYDVLWLPGMDHAGIATQAKVDERLKKEGFNPREMDREEWLKQAWAWKEEYAHVIREQWAKLGLSLDYSKEAFTMDEHFNQAVNKVFIDLYNKGLIYQGERIIHFDPVAKTALSNIEVIYKEVTDKLYYLKYEFVDSDDYLIIATTRPETIFGDVAVAVNPHDQRYLNLIGKEVFIPLLNKKIPLISDDYVDIEFGTGVLKITPAHDQNDFEIGLRHNLERIKCLNVDGTMNEKAGIYQGLDRFVCRDQVIKDLKKEDLFIKEESIVHTVGFSERTDTIIEPYLSKQWFVKMAPLAKRALLNQTNKKTKVTFIPNRFENIFLNWMENIQDWCISRQLWWGHRLPVWYKNDEVYVGLTPPKEEGWLQDEDVLDTWFSSALWPFVTLDWPSNLNKRYFPNNILVTGYDIIFFWVSRMIFQSLEFTKERPFQEVLIHGLIRDQEGRKMSKSLGNGVDPLKVIEEYGADTLRFFLTTNSAPGQDLRYEEEKVRASWNFLNKLFNASSFVEMNIKDEILTNPQIEFLTIYDKWILTRLNQTIKEVTIFMDKYEYNIVGNTLISFIWNDFCDWYLEFSKLQMDHKETKNTLSYVLIKILQLLHPFIPHLTEEIYQTLTKNKTSIMNSQYPLYKKEEIFIKESQEVEKLKEIIGKVRHFKQENNINQDFYLVNNLFGKEKELLKKEHHLLNKMLKIKEESLDKYSEIPIPFSYGTILLRYTSGFKINEIKKLEKEKELLINSLKRRKKLLSNENYLKKAPSLLVNEEQEKLKNEEQKLKIIEQKLNDLF